MMHGAHIGGQRAGAFLELVDGVDPRRVLLVGVDVAKATWFVVASTLVGEVVVDGVRLVADRAGLAELERLIATTRAGLGAKVVVVGVEAAGHYHQTLVGHLGDRDGLVVRLLNPGQVAAVRKQQGNRRRKTDWLDAAAICELLARGEGSPVSLEDSAAGALRPLWSGRKDLVDARVRLRQQAGALVDCLWPGFSARDKGAGVTPVLSDLFGTKAGRVARRAEGVPELAPVPLRPRLLPRRAQGDRQVPAALALLLKRPNDPRLTTTTGGTHERTRHTLGRPAARRPAARRPAG